MDATLQGAGAVVAIATVVGGITGTVIGNKVSDGLKLRIRNAFFLIPSVFTFVGTIFLALAINATKNVFINAVLLTISLSCIWVYVAPIVTLSMTSVAAPLRSRAAGLQIFMYLAFGTVIGPPVVGAISDATTSLQTALQIVWIVSFVSKMKL